MKTIQVFDSNILCCNRDYDDEEIIKDNNDYISNGYHMKWYPLDDENNWRYDNYPKGSVKRINEYLLKDGMVIDQNNKYFHVLIEFSW